MLNHINRKIIILILCVVRTGLCEESRNLKFPMRRSYQMPLSVINNPHGVHYYSAAPFYTAVPTVLVPSEVGLSAMPVANVILPQQEEYKPVQEVPETPPLLRSNHKSSKSTGHFYKKKFKNSDRDYKASPSYFNSIYPATISSLPALQNQNGLSPVSLGNQYHQGGPSASLSVAAGSLMVPTYGPAKAVDYHHKIRTSNNSPETMYHRLTGLAHRYPLYGSKKIRVYNRPRKSYPPNHRFSPKQTTYHKSRQTASSLGSSTSSFGTSSQPVLQSRPMQESLPAYTYNLGHLVRFPNDQDSLQHSKNDPITSDFLSGSTQAISSDSKLTSSTGSPLLVKAVSSNKPFRFKDVYQNPDSSFVNKNQENRNVESVKGQENNYIQYANKGSYQNGHSFGAYFASLPTDHSLTTDSQIINIPGPPAYQNNYLIPEQDLGTSETIKVPVAVIRGTHDITGTEILGLSINNRDSKGKNDLKKNFTPSKRTSDWIPMAGGIALAADKSSEINSESSEEKFFESSNVATKPVGHRTENIISGKIPQRYLPISDSDFTYDSENKFVTGKVVFPKTGSLEEIRRKGSVLDVHPSASSDSSDLVVSSVIKFS